MTGRAGERPYLFLLLTALAWAGGAIAYVPFLTLILPSQVLVLAGEDSVHWLAYLTFTGALAMSIGAIVFGVLSDRTGHRLRWAAAGLVLTALVMQLFPAARSLPALLAHVAAWQMALSMLLAPLAAYAADRVPRAAMGLFGGLIALSPAAGAVAGVIVTQPDVTTLQARLALTSLLVALAVGPLLLAASRIAPPLDPTPEPDTAEALRDARGKAVLMALARLFVQIAEAALFAYLLLYFRSVDAAISEHAIAQIYSVVLFVAVPVSLLAGHVADRSARPLRMLAAAATATAAGLLMMAMAPGPDMAMAGYGLFGLASTVFLSLHSAQMLGALPSPAHRGRDVALANLSSTIPYLVMPWLALLFVPTGGFPALLLMLAALAGIAAVMLGLPRINRPDRSPRS